MAVKFFKKLFQRYNFLLPLRFMMWLYGLRQDRKRHGEGKDHEGPSGIPAAGIHQPCG